MRAISFLPLTSLPRLFPLGRHGTLDFCTEKRCLAAVVSGEADGSGDALGTSPQRDAYAYPPAVLERAWLALQCQPQNIDRTLAVVWRSIRAGPAHLCPWYKQKESIALGVLIEKWADQLKSIAKSKMGESA